MISWATILRGAALTAVFTAVIVAVVARERRVAVVSLAVAAAFLGPLGWNAVLRATHANRFFTDAPIAAFPISWQDSGSGVVSLACSTLALGLGPLRHEAAARVVARALLVGAVALLVDIYLY